MVSVVVSAAYHVLTTSSSATALQSIEIACDTLLSGKAKVMLAGGFDDLSEEGSYEFANMKATSNAVKEFAMGREPTEMSRPTTTTRSGVRHVLVHLLLLLITSTVHGVARYWRARTDEREDCARTRRADSRYCRVHVDVNVSSHIFLCRR